MYKLSLSAILASALLAQPSLSQEYPTQTITVVVPSVAEDSTQTVTGVIAEALTSAFGIEVAVEAPFNNGTAESQSVADAGDGGYVLLSTDETLLTQFVTGASTTDPASFVPIAQMTTEVMTLAVRADSPVTSLDAFYAAAGGEAENPLNIGVEAAAPNNFSFVYGMSPVELSVNLLASGDSDERMLALLDGSIDAAMFDVSTVSDPEVADDLRVLAVFGRERQPALPDVPTARELGYEIDVGLHNIWYAPAGTDPSIVETLATTLGGIAESDEFREAMAAQNITVDFASGRSLQGMNGGRLAGMQAQSKENILSE